MIKTTLVGLGKIGYLYDSNNANLRISHFSSLSKDKRFKIVSVVEKKNKIIKNFKKKTIYRFIIILKMQLLRVIQVFLLLPVI